MQFLKHSNDKLYTFPFCIFWHTLQFLYGQSLLPSPPVMCHICFHSLI